MAMALQLATFAHQWLYGGTNAVQTTTNPLRMGIISTAMINTASVIRPAQTHADVLITAVASRDLAAAQAYARKYGIPSAFGSYEPLLEQEDVDFVYISLPNGMHAEWAMRALEKGKHVLLGICVVAYFFLRKVAERFAQKSRLRIMRRRRSAWRRLRRAEDSFLSRRSTGSGTPPHTPLKISSRN